MIDQKTFAEIDLKALSHNLDLVKQKTGRRHILAVVKANAYGHGAIEISRHLIKEGISALGVAYTHEAVTLRESGIETPILIFFDRNNAAACLDYRLTPVVSDLEAANKISIEASRARRVIPVHVKVDTGMGRIGLDMKKARQLIPRISSLKNLQVEGVMSHFSDADLRDKSFAMLQLKHFNDLITSLKKRKMFIPCIHIANSAAVMTMPGAHFNLVRPGIMLYGYACCEKDTLKPVLSLRSRIILLKKVPAGTPISYARTFITKRRSVIATIPAGYADGYNRKLSNRGEVLINGRRAPVVGRVCMDTIMVDVTDIPQVTYDTEVVVIGRQGSDQITADDLADKTGTISYEILTSIGMRVKRIYS